MATLTTSAQINYSRRVIGEFKEEIRNLKGNIDDLNRSIKVLKRNIDKNDENNQARLKNIKTCLQQIPSLHISLEVEDLKGMGQIITVLSEDLINAQILKQQNSEIEAKIFENEQVIADSEQALTENQQRLIEAENKLYTNYLIKKVAQDIAAFKNGSGNPLATFLTDKRYNVPQHTESAYDYDVEEYRRRTIELLLPLIECTVVDTRTKHSCNSFNSPYCNGLQGAKNDMENILSIISEILWYFDNNGDIASTLHINTKSKPNTHFVNTLADEVNSAQSTDNHDLDRIAIENFLDYTDKGWENKRTFDNFGDCKIMHSYGNKIKNTFRPLLTILKEFKKIKIVSDEIERQNRRWSRKELLTYIVAIKATTATASTTTTRQFFKSASGNGKGYWVRHIASFLSDCPTPLRL